MMHVMNNIIDLSKLEDIEDCIGGSLKLKKNHQLKKTKIKFVRPKNRKQMLDLHKKFQFRRNIKSLQPFRYFKLYREK